MMRRLALAAALALIVVSFAGPAVAASPVAVGPLEVQVWPEAVPGGAVVLIATEFDESVALPVTVRLPLPDGLEVDWAGEIASSNPASDVARAFKTLSTPKGRYAEFELVGAREGQIDLSSLPLVIDGDSTTVTMRYVQSVAASETGFSVRVPAGTEITKATPEVFGKPSTNELGESLYALETQSLKVGEALDVSITYRRQSLDAVGSGGDTLILGLALAAVFASAVLVAVVIRQRSSARSSAGE